MAKSNAKYVIISDAPALLNDIKLSNIELPDTSSLIDLYLGTKYMISDSMVFVANKALSYKLVSDMYNMVFPQGADSEDEILAITGAKLNIEYNESFVADTEGTKLKDSDDLVPLDNQVCSAAEECGKVFVEPEL